MELSEIKKKILHYQKNYGLDHKTTKDWSHGFICGMCARKHITNYQFKELVKWLK